MTGVFDWHGGRLDTARTRFGRKGSDWIDLSTGINPMPWPHVGAMAADWSALPAPTALAELESIAAHYFGVECTNICAIPGSEIGLRLLPAVLPVPGWHIVPAYRTHGAIFPPGDPSEKDLEGPQALLLANPNNPDGRVRSAEEMRGLLRRQREANGWLIVDEAFADASPKISLAAEVRNHRQLILFRSFGKFFGLAGLRLGFVLGPTTVIERYRGLLGDWPIHSAGIVIGAAAYADARYVELTRRQLSASAGRLDRLLRRHGFDPMGDCPLFTLIETKAAKGLFEKLARRAILTRPFDYAPRWLRIGLPGNEEAWQRLDEVLSDG